MSDNVAIRSKLITLKKCMISIGEFFIIFGIIKLINLPIKLNYMSWMVNAIITVIVALIVITIGIITFYRNDYNNLKNKIKNLLKNKKLIF